MSNDYSNNQEALDKVRMDMCMYGTAAVLVTKDGKVEHISPAQMTAEFDGTKEGDDHV